MRFAQLYARSMQQPLDLAELLLLQQADTLTSARSQRSPHAEVADELVAEMQGGAAEEGAAYDEKNSERRPWGFA